MVHRKLLNIVMTMLMVTCLFLGASGQQAGAMPSGPTDETKVPHYFGPNPNWALSPLRQPDVAVNLTGGDGTGVTAKQRSIHRQAPSPRSPLPIQAAVTPLPRRSESHGLGYRWRGNRGG